MPLENGKMPAMPIVIESDEHLWAEGLTKREQFAMAAMQGILASKYYGDFCGTDKSLGSYEHRAAKSAVAHADALLAELEK